MRWFLVVLVAGALALPIGCASVKVPGLDKLGAATGLTPNDEEQIVAVLDDVHQGMQSRQIYKVLAHVARSYHDEEGRDYAAIEAYLNEVFKNYRSILIKRVVPRIVVNGDRARAIETFGTVAEPQNPAVEPPINLQGQVAVDLQKIDGRWQIVAWSAML